MDRHRYSFYQDHRDGLPTLLGAKVVTVKNVDSQNLTFKSIEVFLPCGSEMEGVPDPDYLGCAQLIKPFGVTAVVAPEFEHVQLPQLGEGRAQNPVHLDCPQRPA